METEAKVQMDVIERLIGLQEVDRKRDRLQKKLDQVPIKPQRVFKEINEFFDPDTVFVTAIGLYQIWSGQFQEIQKPYTYFCCGQAGPLGWEVPACMGIKPYGSSIRVASVSARSCAVWGGVAP